ncbi:hypothetical protein GQ43DRAFT_501254, partial [Delitschia confertaspora ATCC 74209]
HLVARFDRHWTRHIEQGTKLVLDVSVCLLLGLLAKSISSTIVNLQMSDGRLFHVGHFEYFFPANSSCGSAIEQISGCYIYL